MIIGYTKPTHFCYLLTLTIHFVFEAEFNILDASNKRKKKKKKKILQSVGECQRQCKSDLTSKWALTEGKKDDDNKVCDKHEISKENWNQLLSKSQRPLMRGQLWSFNFLKFTFTIDLSIFFIYCLFLTRCQKEGAIYTKTKQCPSRVCLVRVMIFLNKS